MIERLSSGDVRAYLNQKFKLRADGCPEIEAELVDVSDFKMRRGPMARGSDGQSPQAFSMIFAAPAGTMEPQQMFRVATEGLGTLDLFLVPLGPSEDGRMAYQAVLG